MNDEEILAELEQLLSRMSIEIRYEKGDFVGGLYRYRDKKQLLINKRLTTDQKIQIIASELHDKLDLQNTFVIPALREVIENASRVE